MKPHLAESIFRRFENDLNAYYTQYPTPYRVNCAKHGLAATTVAGRLRDAKLSLKMYNWPTCIPKALFLDTYNAVEVVIRGDEVLIGESLALCTLTEPPKNGREVQIGHLSDAEQLAVIYALVILHHHRVFQDVTLIRGMLGPIKQDLTRKGELYDISVTDRGDIVELI